jgi:hypothetical protein
MVLMFSEVHRTWKVKVDGEKGWLGRHRPVVTNGEEEEVVMRRKLQRPLAISVLGRRGKAGPA